MGIVISKITALFIFLTCFAFCQHSTSERHGAVIIRSGIAGNKISEDWKKAIAGRMNKERLDSFSNIRRIVTGEEHKWKKLIEAKASGWNGFRDSLRLPFGNTYIHDTVYVLMGYLGGDDGFTYGYQTVCLDVTALYRAYGSAALPDNDNKLDRVFSHEYTHVLHKEWARQKRMELRSFRDSLLWECLYEGIGMYRSLSAKWLPENGVIPQVTKEALAELLPVFVDRLISVQSNPSLTNEQKKPLNAGLSRGPVHKKWGAFPVGIWLALEAKGDDRNLFQWIDKGPEAVILLAKKYLAGDDKARFENTFR